MLTATKKESDGTFMDKKNRTILRCLAMISQVGISMMVPIFLCAGIGWWIDGQFHTRIWFIIMILIGIGAAFRNVYILTLSFYSEDMKKEHERLKYIQELKDYSKNHPGEDEPQERSEK
jgi:ATP synthase protein I